MFRSYQWVAMLHPFELADGVARDGDGNWSPEFAPIVGSAGPREVDHAGRIAWEAVITTTPAYAARCSCCPLLDGEQAALQLAEEGWPGPESGRPQSWRVRLDRDTGVLVQLVELGGRSASGGWTVQIEQVDADLPRELFGPGENGGSRVRALAEFDEEPRRS